MDIELSRLEAEFVARVDDHIIRRVESLADAHGVQFLCPLCFAANKGNVGTHGVLCWFEGRVPDGVEPGPGRWLPKGTGLDDLTFIPGVRSRSVKLTSGCRAHFFVVAGCCVEVIAD